ASCEFWSIRYVCNQRKVPARRGALRTRGDIHHLRAEWVSELLAHAAHDRRSRRVHGRAGSHRLHAADDQDGRGGRRPLAVVWTRRTAGAAAARARHRRLLPVARGSRSLGPAERRSAGAPGSVPGLELPRPAPAHVERARDPDIAQTATATLPLRP